MSNQNLTTALVEGETLIYQRDGEHSQLRVGTSAWYAWLRTATSFRVRSPFGTFTVRREQAGNQRGNWYWRAYRKRDGKLHRVYLGTAEEVTLERLTTVAATLAAPHTLTGEEPEPNPGILQEHPGHQEHSRRSPTGAERQLAEGVRAKALLAAGFLAIDQGDHERGAVLGREVVALQRKLGDTRNLAFTLFLLGRIGWVTGDFRAARAHAEEGLAVARAVDEKAILAYLLELLGQVALEQGEASRARALLEEGLMLHQVSGDTRGIVNALLCLRRMHFAQGEVARACARNEEYLALSKAMGFRPGIADALSFLGCLALQEGNMAMAGELFGESLTLLREVNDSLAIATCLQSIGVAVASQGWLAEAARLWGAAEGLCAALGASLPPTERAFVARAATTARVELGEEAFTLAWAQGRAMTLEQAVAALGRTVLSSHPPAQATRGARRARQQLPSLSSPNELTEREVEVLRLVAQGLTDAQVADVLVINSRTVNAHLRSIYSKLGITSLHAATLFAIKQQLI